MIVTVTPNPVVDLTLTVPKILMNEMARATDVREDWGGKGVNVSRALSALQEESLAMGFVGGAAGQKLTHGLRALEIPTDFVVVNGETRTNVVITEDQGNRYVKVNEPGPIVVPDDVAAFLARVGRRACAGDLWALCGSLPPGVPQDFYAQLIRLLKPHGARVLLDTSGDPFRLGVAARPYLVKPNITEAGEWVGQSLRTRADINGAVDALLTEGVSVAALSLGAEGLLLATPDEKVWAKPTTIVERNPVGAGDALLAGMCWALHHDLSLREIARWGVAAGTAAAMGEGVSVGTKEEVMAVLAEVELWPEVAV